MSERLTRIGKYEVECVVGEGAMGVVYRAVDPVINRRVAIKVMTDAVAQNPGLRERFLREAQAAGSLQHPNVVTIYDFGEIDDHLYIAMEYVEGDDLSEILRRKVPVPVDQAIDLVIGLLHGLAYAHKKGIVHRDIKPANIRVDCEGVARLMDFGVAHVASSEMTNTGMLLGTPSYMAPEQITGSPVFPETDIFSVGAVLYELLAHRRPFESDTLQSLMYQILYKAPEPLETVVPEIPSALSRVVMRALEKEQNQRYRSALAMANDLAMIRDTLEPDGKRTSATSLRATIDTALADERKVRHKKKRDRKLVLYAGGVLAAGALFVAGRTMARNTTSAAAPTAAGTTSSLSAAQPITHDSSRFASRPPTTASSTSTPTSTPIRQAAPAVTSPRQPTPAASPQRVALDNRRPAGDAAPASQVRARTEQNLPAASVQTVVLPAPSEPAPEQRPPNVVQQQPAVSAPAAAIVSAPAPSEETREHAAAQISALIASYARALESRDISQLRRVYPSMSTDQRRAFEELFRSTRSLQADLSVAGLQIDGPAAEAQLTGAFDYVTTAGVPEHHPVSFRAALRREGSTWTLIAVR